MQFNLYKTIIAGLALMSLTVLIGTSHMDPATGAPIITAILFYALGNGIAAASKKPVEPLMQRKPKPKPEDDKTAD